MKKKIFIVAILFSKLLKGQNLVPNSSFEDINICTEYHQPCSPSGWFFIRSPFAQGYALYDQLPSPTGNKHLSIKVLNRQSKNRQYWQCRLLCKLQEGMKYNISVKIASLFVDPNLNDIGFYFTDSLIFSADDTILQPKNYISFLGAKVKKLKSNWFELRAQFISPERKQFLMIGNFSGEIDSLAMDKRKIADRSVSLLIDDVSVIAEDKNICSDYLKTKDSIYAVHERHSFKKIIQTDTVMQAPTMNSKPDTFVINAIQFDVDSYQLSNPYLLDYLKDYLKRSDLKEIKIYGYTDNSGTEIHNKELSLNRATEIARLISLKFGISSSIIKTEGKGISTDYADQKKNRRVEIYIYHY